MAGIFFAGALGAFGLLSLIWTVLGWLLPGGWGCAIVCWGSPDEGILARYWWLRGTGLFRGPLLVVAGEECPVFRDTEICAAEDLPARLEEERNRFNGTGDGDPSGRSQRGGVSEL